MIRQLFLAAGMAVGASPVNAHVTFEQPTAIAGSNYKAVIRVPHTCGESPMTALTLFVPSDILVVKPMPKPGWKLSIKKEPLDQPVSDAHGALTTERVAQISWREGRLLNSEYDEFVARISLPATVGKRAIRVLQECESGSSDWAQIAVPGNDKPAMPAPVLDVLPKPAN